MGDSVSAGGSVTSAGTTPDGEAASRKYSGVLTGSDVGSALVKAVVSDEVLPAANAGSEDHCTKYCAWSKGRRWWQRGAQQRGILTADGVQPTAVTGAEKSTSTDWYEY